MILFPTVIPYWFKHNILRRGGHAGNAHSNHYSFDAPQTLKGLLPPAYDEATHFHRSLAQLRSKDTPLEKYIVSARHSGEVTAGKWKLTPVKYLAQLKDANLHTFYKLCAEHLAEITPVIYTPTVGDACINFSHIYRRPEGLVGHAPFKTCELMLTPSLSTSALRTRVISEISSSTGRTAKRPGSLS